MPGVLGSLAVDRLIERSGANSSPPRDAYSWSYACESIPRKNVAERRMTVSGMIIVVCSRASESWSEILNLVIQAKQSAA